MNTEQLKMLLDALSAAAPGAREAFYWWLLADRGLTFLAGLAVCGLIAYLVRLVLRAFVGESRASDVVHQVSSIIGDTVYPSYTASECHRVVDGVRRLAEKAGRP